MNFLPSSSARGALAFALLAVNTLACSVPLVALSLFKLALPCKPVRQRLDPVLNAIANAWVSCNGAIFRLNRNTAWQIAGVSDLEAGSWYMVVSNHQCWADILVLQRVLGGRIPLLKFFLKHELIYVPVIGLAWWALDFPFLRRHGKSVLRSHPGLRLQDRDATRKACERFSLVPTSVMSFPEGTRFTPAKRHAQDGQYRHLLPPKSGALAMALDALGGKFRSLVDVTIVYPDGIPTFWQFLCGRCPRIVAYVRQLPISPELCAGDYAGDPAFRSRFHRWLSALWHEKDELISYVLAGKRAEARDGDRAAAAGNEVLTQDNEPEVRRVNNRPIL